MKVLVFSPGYIGERIVDALRDKGHEVFPVRVEITDEVAVRNALEAHKPDAVLNCAGKKERRTLIGAKRIRSRPCDPTRSVRF